MKSDPILLALDVEIVRIAAAIRRLEDFRQFWVATHPPRPAPVRAPWWTYPETS